MSIIDPEALLLRIAIRHGLAPAHIRGPSRAAHIMVARRELYAALRSAPYAWSLVAVAQFVNRDPKCILSALRNKGWIPPAPPVDLRPLWQRALEARGQAV